MHANRLIIALKLTKVFSVGTDYTHFFVRFLCILCLNLPKVGPLMSIIIGQLSQVHG